MLNNCIVMGRMVRDPELRSTGTGKSVTSFTVACERDIKNQDGSRTTDFIDCVAWGSTAENTVKYFSKGRMAIVEGRLQTRDWKDKDSNKRRNTEIVVNCVHFCGSRENSGKASYDMPAHQPSGFTEIEDEEPGNLPF